MACARLSGMTGLVRKFRNSMGWVAQVRLRDVIALVQRYWRRSKQRPHLSSIWEGGEEFTMPQAKQTSKQKRRSKALPVLGAAGLSLSLASAASAVPSGLGDMPTSKSGD